MAAALFRWALQLRRALPYPTPRALLQRTPLRHHAEHRRHNRRRPLLRREPPPPRQQSGVQEQAEGFPGAGPGARDLGGAAHLLHGRGQHLLFAPSPQPRAADRCQAALGHCYRTGN
nr:uncharacterized protein LOC109760351 [Aegilops tauschii subsp. strangulata]